MEFELRKNHQLSNIQIALKNLLKTLKETKGYNWSAIESINQNRYYIVVGTENIMVSFKRELFFNFGEKFRHLGMKGVGDSLNVSELKIAIQMNVKTIYTIFPNNHFYYISLEDFLNNSIKWRNKEGKELRSISIHNFKRLEDKQ